LLAAATTHDEALPLVEEIVSRYIRIDSPDVQLAAGRFISRLRTEYITGTESIESLDAKIRYALLQPWVPDWLVMLTRNCEYATDIDALHEPFEKEFAYIAELWNSSSNRMEFESKYSREISNRHDAKCC